jgi:RHS repeat-associated protein
MRAAHLPLRTFLSLALGAHFAQAASSLGRSYSHGFQNGNLVRNWSFEKLGDNWHDESLVQARYRASLAGFSAISGTYVAKVSGTNSSGSAVQKLVSELFPVQENTAYALSMEVRNASLTANIAPSIQFYEDRGGTSISPTYGGGSYSTASGWQSYNYTLTTPAKAAFAKITLVTLAASQSATLYFDDVVLEKGSQVTPKADIREALALTDDQGQVVQSQTRIAGSGQSASNQKYLVQANEFDHAGRLDKSYLPYMKTGSAGFDGSFATNAQAYNNGSQGPTGKTSLVDRHYQDLDYWEEPGSPVHTSYMPGTNWSNRGQRSGWHFVPNLNIIDNPDVYTTSTSEAAYRMEWSKDVEGRFSLSWSNREGQVVKSATKVGGVWKATNFEYYPNGALKKTLTPMDVPGNESQQEFREVTNYNSQGQVTSRYTKDRGLTKFWYNRLGQVRFSQHESQAPNDYTFTDYDGTGRHIAGGVQTLSAFTASMADDAATSSTPKIEHKGYLYDNLNAFQTRTGFALSQILPGKTVGVNGDGKLTCDFNFNKEIPLPALGAQDRLVATFYNYDQKGRITEAYKYIGAVKTAAERVHKAVFAYDDLDRLASTSLYNDASTPVRQSLKTLYYDSFGRVNKITGEGGKFISSYEFYDWGGAKKVILGGTGTATTGLRIEFTYHGQGWLKEIKATQQSNGQIAYQQILGYEAKADPNTVIPGLLQVKYDGSISQQINKFTSDLNALGSVRLTNYQYDDWNRMLTADARRSSGSPLASDQSINYASLAWSDTEDMDSRMTYDDVGRISTNQSGVAAGDQATYYYQPSSYRLDKVTGKLNPQSGRNASAPGTFTYDARGRLTEDKSKKLSIRYGWDDMPVEFSVEGKAATLSDINLYDAAGNRVSRVKTSTSIMVPITLDDITFFVKRSKKTGDPREKIISSITDAVVISMGDRRWQEDYSATGAVAQTKGVTGIFGESGIIGDISDNGSGGVYRFFVKNHLGSTMITVDDQGNYANGRANDYLAYGSFKDIKVGGSDPVVPKFTGKEFEGITGLYYFGARFYDPELALWTSGDPARQFFNPYRYGASPVMGMDYDGQWFNPLDPDDLSDIGDALLSGGGTIVLVAGGAGSCVVTGGAVCFTGYYNHQDGEVQMVGGGVAGSAAYAWTASYDNGDFKARAVGGVLTGGGIVVGGGRIDTETGEYGGFLAGAGIAPMSAGGISLRGNYNTNEFQVAGAGFTMVNGATGSGTIYRTRENGFGASLNGMKKLGWAKGGSYGHHNRNEIGCNYCGDYPKTLEEAELDPNWIIQPTGKEGDGYKPPGSAYPHGGSDRASYVVYLGTGPNEGKQLVYNRATGQLVTDPNIEGTWNYGSWTDSYGNKSASGIIKHTALDVIPWILYGN